ncbi:MAG: SPASM domain-containing protein [Acidimicrobiales bacterium]
MRARRRAIPLATACHVPATHLYLHPSGDVRVCCRNQVPLGNIVETSLTDMWRRSRRRSMVDELSQGRYPHGCDPCAYEVAVEGWDNAFPRIYDRWAEVVEADGIDGDLEWPAHIEFNLSNTCNLMCIQCDGTLSSMIRLHREKLPPTPKPYGDAFFAELEAFIPHLREAQFAGGEPFLAPENFRVWEMVERLNPELRCVVITNATQWNDKIERVGRTLNMGYTFSIDGMTAATYQKVRVSADFDRTMANVPRYVEMARAKGQSLEVNFCLMQQNYMEFGDLLLWAESMGAKVNAQVVRHPPTCSLASLEPVELRTVVERLERQADSVLPHLEINRGTWIGELARLRSWAEAPDELRRKMWSESASTVAWSTVGLLLRSQRDAGHDEARDRLRAWSGHDQLHELSLDVGDGSTDPVVTSAGASFAALVGIPADALVGRSLTEVAGLVAASQGGQLEMATLEETGVRITAEMTYRDAVGRSTLLSERDAHGALDGATVLLALRPTAEAPGGAVAVDG